MSSYRREGFRTLTPYLIIPKVRSLIAFLEKAFDAHFDSLKERPDGSVMHVEMQIGDSKVMMGEPNEPFGSFPGCIYLYVPDCDETFAKAIDAGGESIMHPTDMPSGERYGGIKDPSGNQWWIATHIEDLSDAEEEKRFKKFFEERDK